MSKKITVAVTGGAGQIAYALLFRMASGQVFGPEIEMTLKLLEVPQALSALRGVAMELEDGAFPLLKEVVVTDDPNVAMQDVNWVILIGAMPRQKGMERSDLLSINGKIFTAQGRAINERAASDVRIFVVANPCNTNCLVTLHHAPDISPDRFYAMTRLDANRAKAQLAQKAAVSVTDIQQIAIWGNHSLTQYPDFYHAKIQGQPAVDVIDDEQWLKEVFISIVQKRGSAIIEARGGSSVASAASAIVDGIGDLINDTNSNDYYSVCRYSKGEYDVDEGLIFSFPSYTQNGDSQVVLGIEHNSFAQTKLDITLKELRQERDLIKTMRLI